MLAEQLGSRVAAGQLVSVGGCWRSRWTSWTRELVPSLRWMLPRWNSRVLGPEEQGGGDVAVGAPLGDQRGGLDPWGVSRLVAD
jgi:hypothetical protein